MANHTPGPWHAELGIDGAASANGTRTDVRAADGLVARTDRQALSGRMTRSITEQEANARLIAEAPAMYEALRTAVEAIRLTREYVGEALLPPMPGWAWYDATEAINDLLERIDGAAVEA